MSWRPPPRLKPGPISREQADDVNEWFTDISRFLGGFQVSAPLTGVQDRGGFRIGMNSNVAGQLIGQGGCGLSVVGQDGSIVTNVDQIIYQGPVSPGGVGNCNSAAILGVPILNVNSGGSGSGSGQGCNIFNVSVPPLFTGLVVDQCDQKLYVFFGGVPVWCTAMASCSLTGSGSTGCTTTACSWCPGGVSFEFEVDIGGVLGSSCTDPASINKLVPLIWQSGCIWQSPNFTACGGLTFFWRFTLGSTGPKLQLLTGAGVVTVVVTYALSGGIIRGWLPGQNVAADYGCSGEVQMQLISSNSYYTGWPESVTVTPICNPSDSGGGGTVTNACCPGVNIPTTLYAHITNVSNCACLDGQILQLVWDGSLYFASGALSESGCNSGNTINLRVNCTGGNWNLNSFCGTSGNNNSTNASSVTCSPLSVLFSGIAFNQQGVNTPCCQGTVNITVLTTP
jgi:hypothetical protein